MIPALQKFCFLPVHETNKDPVAHGCIVKAKIDLYSKCVQTLMTEVKLYKYLNPSR